MSGFGESVEPTGVSDPGENTGFDPNAGSDNTVDLSNPYLSRIPETDRAVVAKYVKDWDRGVNERFRGIHQEYAPYKQLGADPQTLQQALQVYQLVQSDPARVRQLIDEHIASEEAANAPPEYADQLPAEFLGRFDKVEQLLMGLAERFLDNQRSTTEQTEDQQLTDYLGWLTENHGEFDETWVLSRMMQGMDGPQAVQAYNEFLQSATGQKSYRPMPPILGGGGNVGQPLNTDIAKASSQDVRNLVSKMLADSQE